ncbi:D-alanine--D-alanine ligase [Candidatus Omnitrophota bacterium]
MSKRLKDYKIGVFRGGTSSEREISLLSGANVLRALKKKGYQAIDVDLATENERRILNIISDKGIDLVFIALHGGSGEDGRLQRILEEHSLPFTGSGAEACRRAMDKTVSHRILKENKIPLPEYWIVDEGLPEFSRGDFPLVVKPHHCGSSIGVSIVKDKDLLQPACDAAGIHSPRVIVERYISGRELTVGIVGERTLPVVEVVFSGDFFDFSSKYEDDRTRFIVPADIDLRLGQTIQQLSRRVYAAIGCRHFARVDLRLDSASRPYVLELNAIPGLTGHSLLPLAAAHAGIGFDELCEAILIQAAPGPGKKSIYEESAQKKD